MKVVVYSRQQDFKLSKPKVKDFVKSALDELSISCDMVIFHFVTQKAIAKVHDQLFNDPTPTDCITCPIDGVEVPGFRLLGEAFVCPGAALEFAGKRGVKKELSRYIVHCLLHMVGYQDNSPSAKRRMRLKENRLLSRLAKCKKTV